MQDGLPGTGRADAAQLLWSFPSIPASLHLALCRWGLGRKASSPDFPGPLTERHPSNQTPQIKT